MSPMDDFGDIQSVIYAAEFRNAAQMQALVSLRCMEDDLIAQAQNLFKQMKNYGSNYFKINK